MFYSDRLILRTLSEMTQNERRPLTADEISTRARVPHSTTLKALDRLIRDGKIRRDGGGRRWGYIYEVLDD